MKITTLPGRLELRYCFWKWLLILSGRVGLYSESINRKCLWARRQMLLVYLMDLQIQIRRIDREISVHDRKVRDFDVPKDAADAVLNCLQKMLRVLTLVEHHVKVELGEESYV